MTSWNRSATGNRRFSPVSHAVGGRHSGSKLILNSPFLEKMGPQYSVDISSPITPLTKSEQEGESLLPGPSLSDAEEPIRVDRAQRLGIWRRVLNPLLVLLAFLSTSLAISGWTLYWRSLPRLHLAGEINGLVPECRVPGSVLRLLCHAC